MATMRRKAKNSTQTLGMVLDAACWIWVSVAVAGSAVKRLSSRP
jgi:hypothetical protein